MAALLAICSKEEGRAVIRFLWLEGVSSAEIYWKLLAQYGDTAQKRGIVYEWIEKFKSGWTNVMHEMGAGCHFTSTTDEKIQQARKMVMGNRPVTIDEVALSLQISPCSVHQPTHNELAFHKVCAKWVPRELSAEQSVKHLEVCQRLPNRYNDEGEELLSSVDTGDETGSSL